MAGFLFKRGEESVKFAWEKMVTKKCRVLIRREWFIIAFIGVNLMFYSRSILSKPRCLSYTLLLLWSYPIRRRYAQMGPPVAAYWHFKDDVFELRKQFPRRFIFLCSFNSGRTPAVSVCLGWMHLLRSYAKNHLPRSSKPFNPIHYSIRWNVPRIHAQFRENFP